jgi:hypothetical protein
LQPARLAAQVRADTQLADMTLWRAVRIGIEAAMQVGFKARRSADGPSACRRRTGCSPHFCLFAARSRVGCCILSVALSFECCTLLVASCLLSVAWCMLSVACHMLPVASGHISATRNVAATGRQWTIKLIDLHRMPNLDETLAKAERTSLSDRCGPVPHTGGAVQNRK